MCSYLNIIWAMQQDPSRTSWDAGDGQVLCAQVCPMVQSAMLLGAQVSVGKVLYWGLELKAVTTPYLADLDASRPEVMVKDMAMLHADQATNLTQRREGCCHIKRSLQPILSRKRIFFFWCPNCFAVALWHSSMTYLRRVPPPRSSCRAHADCVARTTGLIGPVNPCKRSAAAVRVHVPLCFLFW